VLVRETSKRCADSLVALDACCPHPRVTLTYQLIGGGDFDGGYQGASDRTVLCVYLVDALDHLPLVLPGTQAVVGVNTLQDHYVPVQFDLARNL